MKTLETAKLSRKERESILEAARALKSDLPVTRAILFGSKARGELELNVGHTNFAVNRLYYACF